MIASPTMVTTTYTANDVGSVDVGKMYGRIAYPSDTKTEINVTIRNTLKNFRTQDV